MASERRTRKKSRNSGFLHVRSMPHIKMLEKMMKKKDTLVYIYAPWCGACREFDAKVMNHVQSLKNKTLNIAKIDSKFASKTGLPPVKYLPTLMLVGKDGVPATFKDENGEPTNSMPRGNTLMEDKDTLSTLVQTPSTPVSTVRNTVTLRNRTTQKLTLPSYNSGKEGSPPRANVTLKSLAKSPYDTFINGMPTASLENSNMKSPIKASIPVSNPPDIGADLLASQQKTVPKTKGGMLEAIRNKVNALNSLTRLRKNRT